MHILLTTALTFFLGFTITLFAPDSTNRHGSYLMGVADNYDRIALTQSAPSRLVLLGGSSIGWGVSAERMTKRLGIETVNLGVHAGIGYKNIWRLYSSNLSPERDIIVLSPEYSMVKGGPGLTRTYCDVIYLTKAVNLDGFLCGAHNVSTFIKDNVFRPQETENSLYRRDGFNDYGDYILAYDLTNQGGFTGGETLDLIADQQAILQYQAFITGLVDAGFQIIYIPTTVAQKACREADDQYWKINMMLAGDQAVYFDKNFPFCQSDVNFVNTSYHPNRAGMTIKTNAFIQIIQHALQQ